MVAGAASGIDVELCSSGPTRVPMSARSILQAIEVDVAVRLSDVICRWRKDLGTDKFYTSGRRPHRSACLDSLRR